MSALARASQLPILNGTRTGATHRFIVSIPALSASALVGSDRPTSKTTHFLDQKLTDLKYSLSINGNASRIWSQYTSLLNYLGHENLSLEIHQQVLRKCTPPTTELRFAATRRLLVGNKPTIPHMHEGRFQTVIRMIRAMGMKPSLDDYHFILEQFAAVGHHVGVMHVYKELLYLGLEPKVKTFGLCFQAIAHRLTLPVLAINHPRLIAQTKKMTAELLRDMQKYRVSFTSVNLDLCTRILKETLDWDGFNSLLKWGYGIDLSNPDRAPLEYTESGERKLSIDIPDIDLPTLPKPLPFSTAALNTTIDMLGRLGNVPKMVQAFEVLTQPLPQANQHLFSSFDDDDFGITVPVSPSFVPPWADPNTTTFTTLIRHLCRAGHTILARHYLLQIMELEKRTKHSLRIRLGSSPLDKVTAPRIAINRATLLSVFGESHRDKNVGLMRWLNTKLSRIIRKKRAELEFFRHLREGWNRAHELRYQLETIYSDDVPSLSKAPLVPVSESPSRDSSSLLPSSSLRAIRSRNLSSRARWNPAKVGTAFDVDLDRESATLVAKERKPFNVGLHANILERDLREIEQLASKVDDVLGRTVQRVKERLGRRVWGEKNIYLHTERGRVKVSRTTWAETANFQPRRGYKPGDEYEPRPVMPRRSRTVDPSLRIYRRPLMKWRPYSSLASSSVANTASSSDCDIHGGFPIQNRLPSSLRWR
ncbi:hypothetical protein AX15_002490 [Amanita polypyramis BW_CC]|nr:hypothetical protein AX15_002490 [Amanita polypyramis BW_CC]